MKKTNRAWGKVSFPKKHWEKNRWRKKHSKKLGQAIRPRRRSETETSRGKRGRWTVSDNLKKTERPEKSRGKGFDKEKRMVAGEKQNRPEEKIHQAKKVFKKGEWEPCGEEKKKTDTGRGRKSA